MFEPPSTKLFNEDVPRTIHTGEEEALEEDRRYVMPELRQKRKKAMMYGTFFMALTALLFCLFVPSPYNGNLSMDGLLSHISSQLPSANNKVIESPRQAPQEHPREAFFHHFHMEDPPSMAIPSTTTTSQTVVKENKEDKSAVAMLAGAGGLCIGPLLLKMATLLGTGGFPAMGAVTVFTVTLAPVMKGIDVLVERLMRKLRVGKK